MASEPGSINSIMYIHIGNNVIVSDRKIIGIFNAETVLKSERNKKYFDKIKPGDNALVIDRADNCLTTKLKSITLINRSELSGNIIWRRKNDSNL